MDTNNSPARFPYLTPFGAFQTWEEAAAACERADYDPCTCIEYVGNQEGN